MQRVLLLLLLLVVVLVMRREVMRTRQGVVDEQLRRRLASDAGGSGGGGGELVQVRALSEDAALVATELGAPVLKPHLQHSTAHTPRRAAPPAGVAYTYTTTALQLHRTRPASYIYR